MKTLYLVRHAKSDWEGEDLSDIDRPLNMRGYRDAHFMSTLLKEKKLIPDLIITSPAVRAISTALIFCRNFNLNCSDIHINANLYGTGVNHYISSIAAIDNRHKSIMLFGHNPIISNLANTLTSAFTQNMPTCCIIGVRQSEDNVDWKSFNNTLGELVLYDFPKNHIEKNSVK